MGKNVTKIKLFQELSDLYDRMEEAYTLAAEKLGLSCQGCTDNCCKSFFLHHTYIEWAYLWEGIKAYQTDQQQAFLSKAGDYVERSRPLLAQGLQPRLMCPLNEKGRCQLYGHRLMICRMHGVPNSFVRPDGKILRFPGCLRCQELYSALDEAPMLDRTPFYRGLASLEMTFLKSQGPSLPRVKLTLAEMLVQEPPTA